MFGSRGKDVCQKKEEGAEGRRDVENTHWSALIPSSVVAVAFEFFLDVSK